MLAIRFIMLMIKVLSLVLGIYSSYFLFFAAMSPRKKKETPHSDPKFRFICVIPARNEQAVIGNLIDSLQAQKYPDELIRIIVVPNNCTDNTKKIALEKRAEVMECLVPTKSKGDVLNHIFPRILEFSGEYSAISVFDADNLVDENFFIHMNNELCQGAMVAQCYRDSKNPFDTAISGCYSIYYWMINRFYSHAHSVMGLSAVVNGSGFIVNTDYIQKIGGWNTATITEDIEFTALCALDNQKIAWVEKSVIYDEQPLTFAQSWKQRKRWSTGLLQGCGIYLGKLFRTAVRNKSLLCWDQFFFFLAPIMQVLYVLLIVARWLLEILSLYYMVNTLTEVYRALVMPFLLSCAVMLMISAFTVTAERKWSWGILKGVFSYWFFFLTWVPINLLCLFRQQTTWEPIEHVRNITQSEISGQACSEQNKD